MDTVVITGGAGFIGSCLVRQMVMDRSIRVVTLDKLTYAGNLDSLESVMDRRTMSSSMGTSVTVRRSKHY